MSDIGANPPQPRPTQAEADEFMADALGVGDDAGGPAWLPAGAKIQIDFVGGTPQGRAWVDGTGEVGIDTLLGSDLNTDNGWGETGYSAANIVPDGYLTPEPIPAFIGDARARIVSQATLVIQLKQLGAYETLGSANFVILSADGSDGLELDWGINDLKTYQYCWNGEPGVYSTAILNISAGAVNRTAITITLTRFESASNGGAVVVYPVTEAGRPAANPLVSALLDFSLDDAASGMAIQSITIYDPLPTTAGLSALSAIPSD